MLYLDTPGGSLSIHIAVEKPMWQYRMIEVKAVLFSVKLKVSDVTLMLIHSITDSCFCSSSFAEQHPALLRSPAQCRGWEALDGDRGVDQGADEYCCGLLRGHCYSMSYLDTGYSTRTDCSSGSFGPKAS